MVTRETQVADYLRLLGVANAPDRAIERLVSLAEMLGVEGVSRGIVGPKERDHVLERHVLDSCALFPFINSSGPIVDVGTGGGLPGLALACIREGDITLIDAQDRRVAFLRTAIKRLGLSDVRVMHARAEDAGRGELRESAASVVARALAAPPVALELCLPIAALGGNLVLATTARAVGGTERRSGLADVAAKLGGTCES